MPPPWEVEPLSAACLGPAVALHRQALPATLNSRLGAAHLARLYLALQHDPAGWVRLVTHAGQVIGVVSAVLDPDQFVRGFLARLTPWQWAPLLARLALHPRWLLDWRAGRDLRRPLQWQGQPVRPCLTAIAVAAGRRRSGVGQALVASVDGWARAHAFPAYYLDTQADNHGARAFYQRLGFVEAEQRGDAVMLVRVL